MVGDVPFHPKWAMEVTHPPLKIAHVDRFLPVTSQQYELVKKVQLWWKVSRLRAFQRAINEGCGLSLTPLNGVEIPNLPVFGIKVNFTWMKCATKFLWEKTSSGKVVVHSFPYLTVHICWGNTNPLTSDVATKWCTPLTKRWIADILACSSSAVTAVNVHLRLIESRSRAFQWGYR